MKYKILLLLLLSFNILQAQELDAALILNSRNSVLSNKFDYYSKVKLAYIMKDTNNIFKISGGYERTNGLMYHQFSTSAESKYSDIEYYIHTYKKIEYITASLYYPVWKYVDIGYNLMKYNVNGKSVVKYNTGYINSAYIKIKYKALDFDIAFSNKINRVDLDFKPAYKWYGINVDILYIDKIYIWNIGVTIRSKYKFNNK
jgi:hypothetical protein